MMIREKDIQLDDVTIPVFWYEFFCHFLHWNDAQVRDWSRCYEADIYNPNSFLHHDGLFSPLGRLLIPLKLLQDPNLNAKEKILLAGEINKALSISCVPHPLKQVMVNWESASAKIDSILAHYGYRMTDIDKRFRRFDWNGEFVEVLI